jgi:stage III sporulation protein AG
MEEKKTNPARKKRGWILLLGGILGVALILLGNVEWTGDKRTDGESVQVETDPMLAHTQRTEKKIANLCSQVRGVGRVQVIVTFEGDFTYVYATNREETQKEGVTEAQTTYITVGSGASEQPVLLTRTYPSVSGIGIVCEGGGDANVRSQLLSLLSATFGIGSNKIYIAEANPGE